MHAAYYGRVEAVELLLGKFAEEEGHVTTVIAQKNVFQQDIFDICAHNNNTSNDNSKNSDNNEVFIPSAAQESFSNTNSQTNDTNNNNNNNNNYKQENDKDAEKQSQVLFDVATFEVTPAVLENRQKIAEIIKKGKLLMLLCLCFRKIKFIYFTKMYDLFVATSSSVLCNPFGRSRSGNFCEISTVFRLAHWILPWRPSALWWDHSTSRSLSLFAR